MRKLYETSPKLLMAPRIHELVKVYQDLERTLRGLKRSYQKLQAVESLSAINILKLIYQLSRSKKRLERKIGNTILLEKQQLKRRIRAITHLGSGKAESS